MKKENRYPTTKEICCWRLLRARRNTNEFFTSEQTIKHFETSKTLAIIGWLLTVNLFLMYTIALLPFIIKSKAKVPVRLPSDASVEDLVGSSVIGYRILEDTSAVGAAVDPYAQFNKIMNIVNIAYIGFTVVIEFMLLCV